MKKYSSVLFWYLPCLLVLALLSACRGNDSMDDSGADGSEYLYLTYVNDSTYEQKEVRATDDGTVKENEVQTLTVAFFDRTTGEKKTFSEIQTPIVFNVISPTESEWKDGKTSTRTVKIKMLRREAQNLVVYAFANLTPGGQNAVKGAANLSALAALKSGFSIHALNPNVSTLSQQMTGSVEPTADDLKQMKITVPLKRTTTKINLVLHFAYDELVKNESFTYQYKDFPKHHFFIPRNEIFENPADAAKRQDSAQNNRLRTPERFDRVQDTVTLGAFFSVPYDISSTPDVQAPYVVFNFLARKKVKTSDDLPIGWLPPPAGGEYSSTGYVERRHYYRLIMPRTLRPNTHYVIHAYFVGEGGFDELGATPITARVKVDAWVAGALAPIKEY